MKTAMWMLLGVVIGAAIVVPWMLLFEHHDLPVPASSSAASSPSTFAMATSTGTPPHLPADVQKLKDDLQQEISNREIHASPPDHRFGVGMSDYPVH